MAIVFYLNVFSYPVFCHLNEFVRQFAMGILSTGVAVCDSWHYVLRYT
jgi:hypothetical protein